MIGKRLACGSLVLLTRTGCPACEDMIVELEELLAAHAGSATCDFAVIDVDSDVQLAEKYGLRVPVLIHNDTRLCEHRLDYDKVKREVLNIE